MKMKKEYIRHELISISISISRETGTKIEFEFTVEF